VVKRRGEEMGESVAAIPRDLVVAVDEAKGFSSNDDIKYHRGGGGSRMGEVVNNSKGTVNVIFYKYGDVADVIVGDVWVVDLPLVIGSSAIDRDAEGVSVRSFCLDGAMPELLDEKDVSIRCLE
jgi:hypothetical protein